ncbi:hypothetical protein MOV61_25200 [Neorhizobium sp. BETTINA12A]|uniref:hypothetical protein n=1 Tax=Neorhizobium sp. BETTINA12A TaxID=2908924 RepID=UPI001FF35B6A|nr:hypothetical protein [Neorhizobium sp. BETTINA12A]MCJ9754027.1 hypothetical protein [Neorhizobium sp. BETTINA12A]
MANPIETDFKLALALGRLAGRWGQAEIGVEMIYIALSEMPYRKAVISFSFHKSVATQRDIIWFLADETEWLSDDLRKEVKDAVREFADKSATRNGWIHYPFGINSDLGEIETYKMKRSRKGDVLYSKEPANHKLVMAFADEVRTMTTRLYHTHTLLMLASSRTPLTPPPGQSQSDLSSTPPSSHGLLAKLLSLDQSSGK